ncbi:MAG: ATP--dephospho-CoA triphosphoribosyl transferase CitG [Euryarchaeota archaeon]|nr:ATP--dephospho-CoA triphosphoribosyl transferase CitG [Euryarchaeota archaeon]
MRTGDIAVAAQLAILLEVSAPKPGNVTCTRDFGDTRYEHFLASSAAFLRVAEEAARRGRAAAGGRLPLERVRIGALIRRAVREAKRWHSGGNTILGEAMLLLPLCAGAGYASLEGGRPTPREVAECAAEVIRAADYRDTVDLFGAIRAASPRLERRESLDALSPGSVAEVSRRKVSLLEVMEMSTGDSVAGELVRGYPVTLGTGYPALLSAYRRTRRIRSAIVECFLRILAEVPDSLIAKKAGWDAAREVSRRARAVLEAGLERAELDALDAYLRSRGNLLNPGTTADLVAASVFLALLEGITP